MEEPGTDQSKLDELLSCWQAQLAGGRDIPAAELCRDHPELAAQLEPRIARLRAMHGLLGPGGCGESLPAGAPPPVAPAPDGTRVQPGDEVAETVRRSAGPAVDLPGYEVLGELGRGGMGVVYKARHIKLNRVVALKMILAGAHVDGQALARFRTEAEAIARLQHPNIVAVHEVGDHDGLPFLSLEFCPGGGLDRKLAGSPLPPREAAGLVLTLARAVQAAHDRGVIHRDLKPANVLLASPGRESGELIPKVTDFGLAKKLDEVGQTQTGAVMGTPSYMAPEQAEGRKDIGFAADIYALGGILYELLTGRPPFKGTSIYDTIQMVLRAEPVPPSRLSPGVPRDLETICLKCLRKEPARRFESCDELANDLQRWLAGEPIHARRAGRAERLVKWARRQPAQAAAVGLGLLALLGLAGTGVGYGQYQRQQAGIAQDRLNEVEKREVVRRTVRGLMDEADRDSHAGLWQNADARLGEALAALDAQPDLQADEERAEIGRRREAARRQMTAEELREADRKRLVSFEAHRDDALFHETLFTGATVASDRARALAAAQAALALYGLGGPDEPEGGMTVLLDRSHRHLSEEEWRRLQVGSYELLLVWAEGEAADSPGPQTARKALTVLARAERLGEVCRITTQAIHRRKARYLALASGTPGEPGLPADMPREPTIALDWFLKGLEEYRAGRLGPAMDSCAEALQRDRDHFWARYVRGLCQVRLGRWREAWTSLDACVIRRPGFVWARLLRGFAASEMGFKDSQPTDLLAARKDFDEALKEKDSLVRYVALVNRGVLFIRQGQYDLAAQDLNAAIALNPEGFQPYLNLAQAYQGLKRWDEALAALDTAIKRAPQVVALYENRARVHLERKEQAAARADLEKAIELGQIGNEPQRHAGNLVELGKLLYRDGKHEEALGRYNAAIKVAPKFALAHRLEAEALLALNRRSAAGEALDRYLELTPRPGSEVWEARGLIFADARDYAGAIAMYTLAVRQDPDNLSARTHRGWTYLLQDAVRPALEDFEAVLKKAPDNADTLAGRGNARVRLGQMDQAVEDADAAEKAGPVTERLLYNIACIYAQGLTLTGQDLQTSRDPVASRRLALYEGRGLAYLTRALEKMPATRRALFWTGQVQKDPALAPLRKTAGFSRLARIHGQ